MPSLLPLSVAPPRLLVTATTASVTGRLARSTWTRKAPLPPAKLTWASTKSVCVPEPGLVELPPQPGASRNVVAVSQGARRRNRRVMAASVEAACKGGTTRKLLKFRARKARERSRNAPLGHACTDPRRARCPKPMSTTRPLLEELNLIAHRPGRPLQGDRVLARCGRGLATHDDAVNVGCHDFV